MEEKTLVISNDRVFSQPANSALCYAAVLVNKLRLEDPKLFHQVVRQIEDKGIAKVNGLTIDISDVRSSLIDSAKYFASSQNLDYSSTVMMLALAEQMNGELMLRISRETGSVVSVGANGLIVKGGYPEWIETAHREMFGPSAINGFQASAVDDWREALMSGKLNGKPLSLWVGGETARHILLVKEVKNGRVYLLDSFSSEDGYFKQIFPEHSRAEGGNVWSVPIDVLLSSGKIAYAIVNPNDFVQLKPIEDKVIQTAENFIPDILVLAHLHLQEQKRRSEEVNNSLTERYLFNSFRRKA